MGDRERQRHRVGRWRDRESRGRDRELSRSGR